MHSPASSTQPVLALGLVMAAGGLLFSTAEVAAILRLANATGTPVVVGGRSTRLVGRVSMDLLTVDLSDLPEAQPGTPVELWGPGLSVDEVARFWASFRTSRDLAIVGLMLLQGLRSREVLALNREDGAGGFPRRQIAIEVGVDDVLQAHRGIADAAVHAVYAKGGAAVARIAALCPEAVQHGAVDRARLSAAILADPALLKQVEAAVHPLVELKALIEDIKKNPKKYINLKVF